MNKEAMKILAVIPARGGSKGVPGKNIKPLAGRPLIAWTIGAARRSRFVNRLVVSTDDPHIAEVSQAWGAEVVERPAAISGDAASSEAALLHTLDHLRAAEGYEPDVLVFLQCTAPLTAAADIDGTVERLLESGADAALAAAPFHYFTWKQAADGEAAGVNHDHRRQRQLRQEREPEYLETGAVYAMRTEAFRRVGRRFCGRTVLHVTPLERRLEIDDPVDFQVAEVLLRDLKRAERAAALPPRVDALVLDFDGVLTDNRVWVTEDGAESVACHRGDGWGLARLRDAGVRLLVLSTEANPVVRRRCDKLGIECRHGLADKAAALRDWAAAAGVAAEHVVFAGNDVNDLGCLQWAGCAVAVADAVPAVLAASDLVLERPGGLGAVRELCELILERRAG